MTFGELAKKFDHTLLKSTATEQDIRKLCEEALEYRFASVCVQPCWVEFAAQQLSKSEVLTCTVVGFPLGANETPTKVFEARKAVESGAGEVDMVMNLGWALAGDWSRVEGEMSQIKEALGTVPLKVILETCFLNEEQIVLACQAATRAGARFVKTSTGFAAAGATASQVRLMSHSIGKGMFVKASGGIRTLAETLAMLEAGASRIGASASVGIVKEFKGEQGASISVGY